MYVVNKQTNKQTNKSKRKREGRVGKDPRMFCVYVCVCRFSHFSPLFPTTTGTL